MNNWDLTILMPIILVLGLAVFCFLIFNEKLKKDVIFFILEVAIFWIAAGFITFQFSSSKLLAISSISKAGYIILLLFSSSLFTIFLKPIATFFTGVIRMRKVWLWISYGCLIIISLILFIVPAINATTFIVGSIFLSVLLATSTIHYLFLNEQYFYRINTLPVTWILFTVIGFSTLLSFYFSNLQEVVIKSNFKYIDLSCLFMGIIVLAMSFIKKENKSTAGVFDPTVISQLPKKNNYYLLLIYCLTFFIALTYYLSSSLTTKYFIQIRLIEKQYAQETIRLMSRLFDLSFLAPSILVSYFIFKYLLKYFGQKYFFVINNFLLFGCYTALAFITNPFAFLCVNILIGVFYNQLIYTLFSVCMFWNYRAPKNPVTGFFGSALFGAKYLVESLEGIMLKNKVGSFKEIEVVDNLVLPNTNLSTISSDFADVITILFSICAVILLLCALIFYYTSNKIFVDFVNYRLATQNLKNILKRRVIEKTKTQIDVENLELSE
ncbi:hypothetical protein SCHIN_v1c03980 [Spiroplasma chinense]|uniref:Uncharacterized protein n=1 Tax=Spiroplasma chinense TaxID=216932 RepID=A0A5B9Y469_9MOLU|nr:MFS cation transporter [Spiroplasma chinense]QEH61595.1 hypothetical protein SCHIN_v1c03980 [Spiroplasma chinense]